MTGDDFLTVEDLKTPLERMWRLRADQRLESEMVADAMPPPNVYSCPQDAQDIASKWSTYYLDDMERRMLRNNMQPYLESVAEWIDDTYGEVPVPSTYTDGWYRPGLSKSCVDSMIEFDDWYSTSKQRADESVEGKKYNKKFEMI